MAIKGRKRQRRLVLSIPFIQPLTVDIPTIDPDEWEDDEWTDE